MLKALCLAAGIAAALCGQAQALSLGDAQDAFEDTIQKTRELASRRFEARTGGDEQFIEAAREALRGTYDAIRDVERVDCSATPSEAQTPADRANAIKDCEIAKAEASHELLNRAAYMWQGFKPNYGAIELLMRVRSDVRRFIRLVENDDQLYEDTDPWPSPRPQYDPEAATTAQAGPVGQLEAMQAELQRQAQVIEAMMAVAARYGLTNGSSFSNAGRPEKPASAARQPPQPGGNR
jgi:hypothetical protein